MKLIIILFSLVLIACADKETEVDRVTFKDGYKDYMNHGGEYIADKTKTCMEEKLNINSEKVNDDMATRMVIEIFEKSCKYSADASRKSFEREFDLLINRFSRKEYSMINLDCAKKRLQQLAPDDELVANYIVSDDNAECDMFLANDRNYLNMDFFRKESFTFLNIEECMEPVSVASITEIWKMIIVALTVPVDEVKMNEARDNFVKVINNEYDVLLSCALKEFN